MMASVNEQVNEQGLENMKVILIGKADRTEMERNLELKSNKMVIDPISDFLTRVRNAQQAGHRIVEIPSSKTKQRISLC